MVRLVRNVLCGFTILLTIVLPARAQCAKCKLTDRGDRMEGIASRQVSGGCCALLGVQYQPASGPDRAPSLYLHFWLPKPSAPLIKVWEPETNYLMVPKKKMYDQGLQSFSWPRTEVIEPLGLPVDSLYVSVSDAVQKIHFPALLSTSEQPAPAGPYLFVLQSGGGINVTCTIERQVEGRLVPVRTFQHQERFGGVFQIEWDGKDDNQKPAPEGIYVLRLKGTVKSERIKRLNYTLTFQHHGRS